MRRLTLVEAKPKLARIIGCGVSDSRLPQYANEAQERLLNRPLDPVGSWVRYKVCVGSTNCLVWPRQIRTIKAYWTCRTPGLVASEWFETVGWDEGGYGLRSEDGWNGQLLIDHGTACSFANVTATASEPRKIQAVASHSSDNGKTIHLRYFDDSGQRKYSTIGGTVQEGENLTLSTSGVLTTSNVMTGGLYHVVKASTNYSVRLYSYDVNSGSQSALIGYYEPSETVPIYRQTLVPGLTNQAACPDSCTDCDGDGDEDEDDECSDNKSVTVLAKLQHVPVVNDNDPFVIGNLPALAEMVQSILMGERHEYDAAERLELRAQRELDGELSSYLGDGLRVQPRFSDLETWGAGGILNPIG